MSVNNYQFATPSMISRIRSMLRMDFYRILHTPAFYIFLAIAAIIPAMVLGMTGGEESTIEFTNTWQMIAPLKPLFALTQMGEYANLNMVYIFGGIMLAIFIGHDYQSGFIKNVFAVHAKKSDYAVSKIAVGTFTMTCMMLTYIIGTMLAGLFSAKAFDVNVLGLLLAILSKMSLTVGFSALFTLLCTFFKKHMWLGIGSSFFFGTGLLVIGMGSLSGGGAGLSIFLYGAALNSSLAADWNVLLSCIICSLVWSIIYLTVAGFVLRRRDLV